MTYDTYGNIISKNGQTYFYDSTWHDLLTGIESESIEYDAQGNPTKYLGHTLTWEKGRQLKSFDNNTYTYNANGIRTSKTVNGVKHEYTLDGTKILKETWGENTLIPLYDNEDSVCGIIYNNYAYYFQKNLQGDVIAITNSKCKVVATYTYDAWGVCTIVSDNTGIIANVNPFRYRSYYFDQHTGLYYLQSRYYDPQVGRFINGDDSSVIIYVYSNFRNLFSYCNNLPTNDKDDFGFASTFTKNKQVNKMFDIILDSMPNVYSSDFISRELIKFRIGTTNLNVTVGFGVCVQSNKNALFGGLFKKGTLEVSAYLGITNSICFSFSAGITWSRAYLKIGLGAAIPSNKRSGLFAGVSIEVSVPTWLLAVATVAVAVAAVYNPTIAVYIAKILATIRKAIRAAASVLVPIVPKLVASF